MSTTATIPVLHGVTLTLRPHAERDPDAVLERCVDPATREFTTVPLEYTRAMAAEYLSGLAAPSPDAVSWALEADGRDAGTLDLRTLPVDGGTGSLGFVTHPACRGRAVPPRGAGHGHRRVDEHPVAR